MKKNNVFILLLILGAIIIAIVFIRTCGNNEPAKTTEASSETKEEPKMNMPDLPIGQVDSAKKPQKNPYENVKIEVKTFLIDSANAGKGYGYDIYVSGGKVIHQYNIPAVSGNRGFKSAADAKKTGELTAYKIRKNIMPPMLTIEELDSLGVLK